MKDDLKLCAWLGPIGMTLLFLGMMPAAHFVPPPSPALSPEEVSAFYAAHADGIRLASMLIITGATCFVVFTVAISIAMLRMEPRSLLLAAVQAASGILGILPLFFGGLIFAAASFRPDRAGGVVQALNDVGWLFFVMPATSVLPQLIALAVAIFRDRAARPVFPRWVAYLNVWVAVLLQPGLLVPFFKQGPFAWDGLLAFWVPFMVFGLWFIVMWWALLQVPSASAAEAARNELIGAPAGTRSP